MQSYLPKEVGPSSGYSEGGGLYALGLIHANHGANIIDYLLGQLKEAQNEVSQYNYIIYLICFFFQIFYEVIVMKCEFYVDMLQFAIL